MMKLALVSILAALVSPGAAGQAPRFYPDDPLLEDRDTLDTTTRPTSIQLSDLYDRFAHIFHDFGSGAWGEAENVNTLDEVPDSSWFTNRHGRERMALVDLMRGPDRGPRPDPTHEWTIFRGKDEGLTPGFSIEDEGGQRYVVKFGSPAYPELNSASEIIATKILYALGYNTPQNYIVYMRPENLRIRQGTLVRDRYGDKVPLTLKRLRRSLRRMQPEEDGSYRVVASKYVEGEPLGPFRYYGTRSDDPNDLYDHEQRRELRGLRLIAAWINHDDTRAINTLDSWVRAQDGRHYVKHFLIDFGSAFGSGTADLQLPNLSFHYWLDPELIKKNASGFGFHVPKYRKVRWPDYKKYPGVGRFEARHFDPGEWKNDYPNPAFVRMTKRDAFWAAKLIMRFGEEELAALVGQGRLRSQPEKTYFLETLIERQRTSGRYGINALNPLDAFRVQGDRLTFENLAERYRFAKPGSRYRFDWGLFDNSSGVHLALHQTERSDEPAARIPRVGRSGLGDPYLVLSIETEHEAFPHWSEPVRIYLRQGDEGFEVVGIERTEEGAESRARPEAVDE